MPWRKISVDGQEYRWRGATYIVVQDADGKRVASGTAAEVKGISWSDWERGGWKTTSDGMMRPSDIAKFIRRTVGQPIGDESETNHKLALLAQAIAGMP